jgi:hypothetical protein
MRLNARLLPIAVLACGAVAIAQPEAKAPLDPAHVVAQFRKAYHKRPFVESLDITVRTPSEKKCETVVVRGTIKGEIRLELGDLVLWTAGERLIGVHRLNAGTYFEAPLDPSDRAASLLRALPPLPVPEVALVLQAPTAPPGAWAVSPLCVEPQWTKATAASQGKKPAVVLEGSTKSGTVRVAGVGDPPVLVFAETKSTHDDVTTTITADISRLDERAGRIEEDLRGRKRVSALSDLRPQTPDMKPGLAMPDLVAEQVERGERSDALVPTGKPCVLVIFDAASVGPEVKKLLALADKAAKPAKVTLRLLAACSITDSESRTKAVATMKRIAPGAGFVSYSGATTLARFAPKPGISAVAVMIDQTGLVQAIVPSDAETDAETLQKAVDSIK